MSLPPAENYNPLLPPPEPPVGTWVMDRHGATDIRIEGGWSPAPFGFYPGGKWANMWEARGPYVECSPYGVVERQAIDTARRGQALVAAGQRLVEAMRKVEEAQKAYDEALAALQEFADVS